MPAHDGLWHAYLQVMKFIIRKRDWEQLFSNYPKLGEEKQLSMGGYHFQMVINSHSELLNVSTTQFVAQTLAYKPPLHSFHKYFLFSAKNICAYVGKDNLDNDPASPSLCMIFLYIHLPRTQFSQSSPFQHSFSTCGFLPYFSKWVSSLEALLVFSSFLGV